jgi:hypothetical protein
MDLPCPNVLAPRTVMTSARHPPLVNARPRAKAKRVAKTTTTNQRATMTSTIVRRLTVNLRKRTRKESAPSSKTDGKFTA